MGSSKRTYDRVFGNSLFEEVKQRSPEGDGGPQPHKASSDLGGDEEPPHHDPDAVTPHTTYTAVRSSRHAGGKVLGMDEEEDDAGLVVEEGPSARTWRGRAQDEGMRQSLRNSTGRGSQVKGVHARTCVWCV